MSVEGSKAVLLTQGGDFKQIRNKNYNIGDKVKVRANYAARIGSIAAALAVFVIGGGASYFIPASYVSVDINPSFLMTLNIYDKVINIEPLNNEAETVLKHTDIKGKNINDTVETLISESRQKGYINDNGGEVIVSVVPSIKTPKIEDKSKADKVDLVVSQSNKTELDEAKDMGVSIAKAKAIEEYTDEFGGSVSSNADKLSGMTVKQIKTEIEDKKELDATPPPVSAQSEKSQINSNTAAQSIPQTAPKTAAAPSQTFTSPQLFSSESGNGGTSSNNNAAEQKHEDNKTDVKQDNSQPQNNNDTKPQTSKEEPRAAEAPALSAPMKPDEALNEPAKTGSEPSEPRQENNVQNNAPASNPPQAGEPKDGAPKDNAPSNNGQQGNGKSDRELSEKNAPSNDGKNAPSQTAPNGGNSPSNGGTSPSQGGAAGGNAPSNSGGGNGGVPR